MGTYKSRADQTEKERCINDFSDTICTYIDTVGSEELISCFWSSINDLIKYHDGECQKYLDLVKFNWSFASLLADETENETKEPETQDNIE
jgi:hypothetical protein